MNLVFCGVLGLVLGYYLPLGILFVLSIGCGALTYKASFPNCPDRIMLFWMNAFALTVGLWIGCVLDVALHAHLAISYIFDHVPVVQHHKS